MSEKRIGRQAPTTSFILPYQKTHGADAVGIYELSDRHALEWQQALAYDLMAVNDEGKWVHTKFGYSVPRQNGKGEVLIIRELYGLATGQRGLHTAHRTSTEHAAWERLCKILDKIGIQYYSIKAKGQERIELKNGGRVDFRTRTAKGGIGESFDYLIIDEAQEYQDDQESALKYVIAASENPQTILCGTPPTPVSSGTVFAKTRAKTLCGELQNTGWAEWSVENESDPHDRELWYECNPSLGLSLSERTVEDEAGGDPIDFNIQRLGLWIKYNQKSAISRQEWEGTQKETLPKLVGKLSAGIKYNRDGETVSLAVAARTAEDEIFTEVVDNRYVRDGTGWIVAFIKALGPNLNKIVVDGANGQAVLQEDLKAERIKNYVFPSVNEFIAANAAFEQNLFKKRLCHMEQPSVTQVVSNCEKRAIGSHGGFGYGAIKAGADISLMDAVILAAWAVDEFKERKKQEINY